MDRCPPSAPTLFSAPIPDDFVFVPLLPNTPNASTAILAVDGRTIKQTQPFSRCTAGGPATSHYDSADVDITGEGITGAHGGSGLSAIGGTLRVGELRPRGPPVRHALKIELDAALNYGRCAIYADCYRWPAIQADTYATTSYGGPVAALEPGALLAIPLATTYSAGLGSRDPGGGRARLHVAELRRLRRRRHRLGGLRPLRRARTRRRLHRAVSERLGIHDDSVLEADALGARHGPPLRRAGRHRQQRGRRHRRRRDAVAAAARATAGL